MKRLFLLTAIASVIMSGCTDKKALKKAAMDSVMNIHERVMGADDQLTNNKMQLDTMIKKGHLTAKDTAFMLREKLVLADSAMYTWMHKFDVEQTGKSDAESIAYLHEQKKLIMSVDSQITSAVSESGKYLKKIKTK